MKGPHRGHYYRAMEYGLKILKSPIADSFEAAADYYDPSDLPLDAAKGQLNPPSENWRGFIDAQWRAPPSPRLPRPQPERPHRDVAWLHATSGTTGGAPDGLARRPLHARSEKSHRHGAKAE